MRGTRLVTIRPGHRLEVVARGRRGPVLVVHPGGPGLTAEYLGGLLGLARDGSRRVVLFHPRGVGRSYAPRLPRAYTLPALARDVDDLRRALGADRIDLLGFSAGGFVALEYARRYPRRLRSLLLCGTAASAADLRAANRTILRAASPAQRRRLRALERRRAFDAPDYARLIEEIERPFQRRYLRRPSKALAASRLHPRVYRAMMTRTGNEFVVDGTLARWDARPGLSHLRLPTLVLVGAGDFLAPAARRLAGRIPGARLVVIDRASHLANLERPAAFLGAVDRFLREVGRQAGEGRTVTPSPRRPAPRRPGRIRGRPGGRGTPRAPS
jgi:proline iminopeptidase